MSGFSEYARDLKHNQFIKEWCPEWAAGESENVRHNLARGYEAIHELAELRKALAVMRGLLK